MRQAFDVAGTCPARETGLARREPELSMVEILRNGGDWRDRSSSLIGQGSKLPRTTEAKDPRWDSEAGSVTQRGGEHVVEHDG